MGQIHSQRHQIFEKSFRVCFETFSKIFKCRIRDVTHKTQTNQGPCPAPTQGQISDKGKLLVCKRNQNINVPDQKLFRSKQNCQY